MTLSMPINQLRRLAKLLARRANIPLHQALDIVAKDEGFQSWSLLAARNPAKSEATKIRAPKVQITARPDVQTIALPFSDLDRAEFVETANQAFEAAFERIEPENPIGTRRLWNAEQYVDEFLTAKMPIGRDYALSSIEALMVHHVIGLAVQADEHAAKRR